MKKIIITVFCVIFLMLLNSCGKCIETQLTKEEKVWFLVYKKGETIIFKSNLGNLDTLVVIEKIETHNNKNCNYYGVGSIQPNIMFITLKSNSCHNDPYCNGEVFISKNKIDVNYLPTFSLFGLNQKGDLQNDVLKLKTMKLTTTNTWYNLVYHFEDGVNTSNGGNYYLKSFDWDKKEGLIRYDTSEGEVFELLKKY